MPLWRIYHPPDLLTPAQKSTLSEAITANYTRIGLPAFYVVILFIPLAATDIFVSGVPVKYNFMRFAVEHIARHQPDEQHRNAMTDRISALVGGQLEKFEKELGQEIRWEIHITETLRELWRVNGLVPPPGGSEEEKIWAREDKPMKL